MAIYDEEKKRWKIDSEATERTRKAIREERLKRGIPAKEWWIKERDRVAKAPFLDLIKETYKESFELSEKYAKEFRDFWQLSERFSF